MTLISSTGNAMPKILKIMKNNSSVLIAQLSEIQSSATEEESLMIVQYDDAGNQILREVQVQ
ncbi:hypothetical protein HZP16_13150 [Elizabethkingia anophelis]|nr:hypothetical protein [Elizabethkingia anophelis]